MHYQRFSIATRSSALNSALNSGINSYWIVSQPVSGTSETSSEICAVTLHAPTSRVSFRVNHRRDLTLFRYTSDKLSRCINCQHRAKRSFLSITYAMLRDIPCRYIILYITILRYNIVSCLFFIVAPVCIRKNGYLFFFIHTNQTVLYEFTEFISACRMARSRLIFRCVLAVPFFPWIWHILHSRSNEASAKIYCGGH